MVEYRCEKESARDIILLCRSEVRRMGELNPGAGPQLYGMPRGASPLQSIVRGA